MQLQTDDLLRQIEEFHLMSDKDIATVKLRWFRQGRKDVQQAARFCEWLRANNYLTEFVLSALGRRKADLLTLNQYRLTDVVRTGAQAGDFLALDPTDRVLRVQIVSPSVAQEPAWFEKFRQAAERVIGVQHPGVARVYDVGQIRGLDYLVSEYVEGEPLEEVLQKRGKLNPELTARIFAIVFDALQALHQNEVRAGELSAEDLVFTSVDGATAGARTVRLMNSGFPRRFFDSSALGIAGKEQLPEGTPSEGNAQEEGSFDMAPRPEEEIFRLGTIVYRCLTSKEPYPLGQPGSPPVPVRQAAPEVPAMLAEFIDRLVDPAPANRPSTAGAVAKFLRVFLKTDEEERLSRVEEKLVVPVASPPPDSQGAETEEYRPLSEDGAPAAGAEPGLPTLVPGEPEINQFFRAVIKLEGSDLHLSADCPPMMRVRNVIRKMNSPPLGHDELARLVEPILTERSRGLLEETGAADFAHILGKGECRFRVNLFRQRGQYSLVARRVNTNVPTFEKLGLPPLLEKLCGFEQGMVILAGVTGSGKSTTLAAMLEYINQREPLHILTIEDPIEYLFTNKKSVINQREVGIDVSDWHKALKHAVRQDPDVILVGEMRDRDTFEAGLNAAETGHLVFCTIHASSAPSTIGRILDLFPADMHQAMRQSLGFNLRAIVCQKLLPSKKPGAQRVPANEIMLVNPTVRDLIIKGEDKKLPDAVRIGFIEGMIDFNESLRQLVARGDVTEATALEASPNPDALKMAFKGIRVSQPGIL